MGFFLPRTLCVVGCLTLALSTNALCQNVKEFLEQRYPKLEEMYVHLHSHPELSFQEQQTAKTIAAYLNENGFEVTEQVGGWGVVGLLRNGNGPTVMLRTDMDALPIREETGKPYQSTVEAIDLDGSKKPVMHACGHDIHMTVFLGTARFLRENKARWQGTVLLVAQPAEERSGGASAMLKAGLFEKFPRPDFILALHVSPALPAGTIGYTSGYSFANVDMVDVVIKGVGGHGAYPHETKDPIVLAAQFVLALQTIVSRETNPITPAVVTVGSIHGGSKHNIIPEEVTLQLTLRSYEENVRNQTIAAIKRMALGLAQSQGLPENRYPTVEIRRESAPSVYNDPGLTNRLMTALKPTLGEKNVMAIPPTMAGEDFSFYGRVSPGIPSLMFALGSISEQDHQKSLRKEITLPSLHSAHYAPVPRPTIETGILALSSMVLDLLPMARTGT